MPDATTKNTQLKKGGSQSSVNVIFSVDTEHDLVGKYTTTSSGWSKGIPLLCDIFDRTGLRGKVCWLVEYNLKDGIVAANPASHFCSAEFPNLITQIKERGDELGLHPEMKEWLGGDKPIPVSSYNDPKLWDVTRRTNDPGFVSLLISSARKEFVRVCGTQPVGNRTGRMQYATHLASALVENGINIDSSVRRGLSPWKLPAPNAYYAAGDDIRNGSTAGSGVLEIPTTGYVSDNLLKNLFTGLKSLYWFYRRKPIFLSFFVHNWQAITPSGGENIDFLKNLSSFLQRLRSHGARFLSWTEAHETYKEMIGNSLKD